ERAIGRPSTKKLSYLYSNKVIAFDSSVRHRCYPTRIAACLENASDSQKQLVRSIGLHRLLDINATTIELQIIAWIVQNYNASTHSIVLHDG
ncbi:hypothetical protein LINGRAHAP2_LOCUS23897, partial [Linum grandiflorum]